MVQYSYMNPLSKKYSTVDEYIDRFPANVQERLKRIRAIIKEIAPGAEEGISYGIAGLKLHGRYFIYFGGFKNHTSLFPFPSGVESFQKAAEDFKTAKGTLQFQNDKPLPVALIMKVVKFRMKENEGRKKKYK